MVQYRKGRKSPWSVQYRDGGKVQTKSFFKREDAIAFEANVQRERQLVRAGMEKPMDGILFFDFAAEFMKRRDADQSLSRSTVKGDGRRLRLYWLEKFGGRALATITSAEILAHLDWLEFDREHSVADRNRHRALMHTLFQMAFMANKVAVNPVARVPLKPENPHKNKKNKLASEKDADAYRDAMYRQGARYGIIVDLMLWTGCRVATAIALQWGDVDFKAGKVRLARQLDRTVKAIVERQKGTGEGGETLVPLFPRLRAALAAHKLKSRYTGQADFIACRDDGRFVPYESFHDAHDRVRAKLKLEHLTPHGLRRTFATRAKEAGYSRAEIREMLNHSSDQVLDRYDIKDVDHLSEKGKRLGFGKVKKARGESA